MAFLFAFIAIARFYYKRKKTNPFSYLVEQVIKFFVDLCRDSFGFFDYDYFAFVMSLFTFTLFCNLSGMLPFVVEPTEDINTALACGLCSFIYVQYQFIKIHGTWGYIKEYFEPIPLLFPLNVIGEFAKILSMSFRLFGNILGGGIIIVIALQSVRAYRGHFMIYVGIILPLIWLVGKIPSLAKHPKIQTLTNINNLIIFIGAWLLMFFVLFEGAVQAFVITMLTITYLSLIGKETSDEGAAFNDTPENKKVQTC